MTTVAEKKAFVGGKWQKEVDLVDFIKSNYTEYRGDASFLEGPTEATKILVEKFNDLINLAKFKNIDVLVLKENNELIKSIYYYNKIIKIKGIEIEVVD